MLEPRCLLAITSLSVENDLTFARVNEPVTSGVPIPESLNLLNTNQLRILDGGNQPVPAQFRVLGRWNAGPDDATKPIRWLEVHFAANVAASSTANYQLDVGGTGNASAALQATSSAGMIDVVTGPARFQINRNGFDLFHTVWLDLNGDSTFATSEQIVVPDLQNGPFVLQGGTEFRGNAESPLSVALEESGPLRAVVRAEGFHAATGGADLLRYVTRLTFFAGQSYVQVDHTIIEGRVQGSGNEFGVENQQTTDIERAGLRVNLQLSGTVSSSVRGAQDTVRVATLGTGATSEISQQRVTDVNAPLSYSVRQNGAAVESGVQATRAWLDLADSRWGLAVSTSDFVDKNPQRLLAEADGTVQVEFPSSSYRIFQAMGLGEQAVFYFHAAGTTTAQLQSVLEGIAKDRLLAVAPASWMVASGAFGDVPAAGLPAPFNSFDTFMENSFTATTNYINQQHASGLLNYFDLSSDRFDQPANPDVTSWGNSYYDPAGAWIKQFARSGETRWLKDLASPYVQHFYTTDAYDTDDPNSYQNGISGAHGPFHRETWTGEYHYLESLWPYYYLTGDRQALERGLDAARSYATAPQWDINFDLGIGAIGNTSRIIAQKFNTMLEGWLASGDASLRTALDAQVNQFFQFRFSPEGFLLGNSEPPPNPYVTDQGWMTTHLMHEPMYKYFLVTGNLQARNFVVTAPQRVLQYHRISQNPASPDFFRFYNQVMVTVNPNGSFTTEGFIIPDRFTDNFFYPGEILGLGTAVARAGKILQDQALIGQARDLLTFGLTQIGNGGLWDKERAKETLRALDGLALVVTSAPALPTVTLSSSAATIAEAGGQAIITATLSAPATQNVTVELAYSGTASNPADYLRSGTQIDISAGSTTGTVTLTGVPDSLVEGSETIIIDVATVTNATESGVQRVTVSITDTPVVDPPPPSTVPVLALTSAGNPLTQTVLFFSGGDHQVYQVKYDASQNIVAPAALVQAGAVGTSLTAVTLPNGSPLVFLIGSDNQVYRAKFNASGSLTVGFALTQAGAVQSMTATTDAAGNPMLLVIGSDSQVYFQRFDANGDQSAGYAITSGGAVRSLSASGPTLFAQGLDNQLYQNRFNGTIWVGYNLPAAGAVQTFTFSAASGLLLGIGGDNQLYAQRIDAGGGTSGWFLTAAGAISAVTQDLYSGKAEAFVLGMDNQVYVQKFDAAGNSLGYAATAPGGVKFIYASGLPGSPGVFAVGLDNQVYKLRFDNVTGDVVGGFSSAGTGPVT